MIVCTKLSDCSFVKCCEQYDKSTAAKGFIKMYCEGYRMNQCVRKRLSAKFGSNIVPANMMPNGSPLPDTDNSTWDKKAKNYHQYLK